MTKNEFIKVITSIQNLNKTANQLSKIGVIITNSPIYDSMSFLSDYIFKKEYGEEGLGWVNWFLYDLPEVKRYSNDKHHAYDSNGIPIILNTITDLYNFLEGNYKNG